MGCKISRRNRRDAAGGGAMSWNVFRVYGDGHLADTLRCTLELKHLSLNDENNVATLAFVAQDVYDHFNAAQLAEVGRLFARASCNHQFVVVLSQVPPGWTRKIADKRKGVFFQVDTLIVKRAVKRMVCPEQFIVGCADAVDPLPLPYQEYLAAHECPVLQMSYESAELAKCAINYMLAEQVAAANRLAAVATKVGADYADVERALRNDARIGAHAYLRPGKINQHLRRDVQTVAQLLLPSEQELFERMIGGA